ncbi:hypothetical protein GMMP15_1440013 [Candidatus Magnetomoraceae bacterium gMMP-15]
MSLRIKIGDIFLKRKTSTEYNKKVFKDSDDIKPEEFISVIIPVYDRTWELKEAIESILNQTYQNFEIIIVTDGSPQKTIDVLKSYESHPKIRLFYYYDNTGNAVRGRNKGIKEAKGEFIAFLDSDDISFPNRLAESIQYLKKNKADIVYGGWKALIDGSRKIDGLKNGQEVMSPEVNLKLLKEACIPCQSTVMVRRSVLLYVGGLKSKMKYREDHELWLRLAYFGYKFKTINKILVQLRLHKGNNELNFKNTDNNWKALMLKEYTKKTKLFQKIAYIVPGFGISGGVAVVLQHANRLLKRGYDVCLINQGEHKNADWFPNNKAPIIDLNESNMDLLQNIDLLIATGWQTVDTIRSLQAKRKAYFVQSDERRFSDCREFKQKINATYLNNFEYFTEAKWIQRWLKQEFGHDAYYVPNGIDANFFKPTKPLFKKEKKIRVLLEGPISIPFKGMKEAYNAIKDLDCEIWIISSDGKPPKNWKYDRFFESVPMLEMKHIYSSCDIFLKMSKVEGFFGPPLEAMSCGCAVVVGDVTGYDEYIVDRENALVSNKNTTDEAKKLVQKLIKKKELRKRLIQNGFKTAKEWSWDKSIDLLEDMIHCKPVRNFYTQKHPEVYNFSENL